MVPPLPDANGTVGGPGKYGSRPAEGKGKLAAAPRRRGIPAAA